MLLGRSRDNHLIIDHGSISREHASVRLDPVTHRYTISDLHATNGLRINGDRCIAHELSSGDVVDLGHVRMRYIAPGEENFWFEPERPASSERVLIVGGDVVVHRGEQIHVGSQAFGVDEVEAYASRQERLPMDGGRVLDAAIALLVLNA